MMRRWTITSFKKNFSKSQFISSKSILNREISTHSFSFFKQSQTSPPRLHFISRKPPFSPTITFFCTKKEEKTKNYNKPLEEWSANEVQDWFQNSDEFAEFSKSFKRMSGKSLALLVKEDFIRRCPEMGDAIYERLQTLKGPPSIESIFEELHKKNPNLPFKTPPNLTQVTKSIFPLKDRENEIKQITEGIIGNFISLCSQSKHKKDWNLFSVVGGSGTGKTRLSISVLELAKEELLSHKEDYITLITNELNQRRLHQQFNPNTLYESLLNSLDKKQAFTIYFDFSNGDNFAEWKQAEKIETAFLLSLASKTFFSQVKVINIRVEIQDLSIFNKAARIADGIRNYYGVGSKEILTILFNFDEFQKMVSEEEIDITVNKRGNKDKILIRQIALTVMSICQQLATFGVHLIPIFSGTLSMNYIGIFPATDYRLKAISIGPIQSESSVEIVKAALQEMKVPESLIATMGNIPRALEYLVAVCRVNSSDSLIKIFEKTVQLIKETYGLKSGYMTRDLLKLLIQLSLSGKTVTREDMIGDLPLGTLEREGTIFLKTKQNGKCQIVVPLVFAAAFNQTFNLFNQQFVTYKKIIKPSDFEEFVGNFEVFKNNLYLDLGIKETTFGERFYGALMSEELSSKKIQLSRMREFYSKADQLPENLTELTTMDGNKESPIIINLAKESASVWIGRNCTSCDILSSYPNQLNGKSLIHLQEVKSTIIFQEAKNTDIKPGEIEEERKNAILGVEKIIGLNSQEDNKVERKFPDHPQYEFLFTFLSNTNLPTKYKDLQKRILYHNDTMIISRDQFEDYFSPMFSYIIYRD